MKKKSLIKTMFRPVFSWAFIIFYVVLSILIVTMLAMGLATLAEASGLLITMIGLGGANLGVYQVGRSWEKTSNVTDDYYTPDENGEEWQPPKSEWIKKNDSFPC